MFINLVSSDRKIPQDLHLSFSSFESGTWSYYFWLNSRWYFLHSSQWIFFATLLCLFLILVLYQVRADASDSVSLTNCPCSAFSFLYFNRFSFFSVLLTLATYFSKLSSTAAVLIDCTFPPRHRPRHLPDFLLHHVLECRVCLHMNFGGVTHAWWWIFFVHCIIPAQYWTVGIAQILIAWNTFPAFSLDLRSGLTRLKYSVLTLIFICSWQILRFIFTVPRSVLLQIMFVFQFSIVSFSRFTIFLAAPISSGDFIVHEWVTMSQAFLARLCLAEH